MKITKVHAREILDSRGNPTVEAEVTIDGKFTGLAKVPSGASTGEKEASELRDNDKKRYGGKGVLQAVNNVKQTIANALLNKEFDTQQQLDQQLIALDGTANKSNLGANAILSVSMAYSRALALSNNIPLYRQLQDRKEYILPVPCMNVINGGRHADNNVDFQEYMIAPHNASSFSDSLRMGIEVFHTLKELLKKKGYSTGVGDEGGFAPDLRSNEEAVDIILEAITRGGFKPGHDISLCLDPATSEMWENGAYKFFKSSQKILSSDEMITLWKTWVKQYPIILLEDGLAENDWSGWKTLTRDLKDTVELVGDDIFCTNAEILKKGIAEKIGNSILIKLNQIGTVSETMETIELAKANNYNLFISHRSGETDDTFIADLTVATNAGHLKTGSGCRGERIAKFNQLLRIEEELGKSGRFAGLAAFKK
jgi:enolase